MSLSQPQMKCLFSAVRRAAENLGRDGEEYRREVLREELGVEHLRDVTKTSGFDKLMQRILSDAGEYEEALSYTGGDVKRLRFLAIRAATRICINQGAVAPGEIQVSKYIAGVIVQMRFSTMDRDSLAFKLMRPDGYDDFTEYELKKVVAALQKHVRRSAKNAA